MSIGVEKLEIGLPYRLYTRCSRTYFKFPSYQCDVRLWPKADIRAESKWVFLNVCFRGEKQPFMVKRSLGSQRNSRMLTFDPAVIRETPTGSTLVAI